MSDINNLTIGWYYTGHEDLESGGTFYMLGNPVRVLEVFPDQDVEDAGPAQDAWYINHGGLIFLEEEGVQEALRDRGYEQVADSAIRMPDGDIVTGLMARRIAVEAYYGAHGVEDGTLERISRNDIEALGYSGLAEYVKQVWIGNELVLDGPEGMVPRPRLNAPEM